MTIDRQKCMDWLMANKHHPCCETPIWSFTDNQDGAIKAICEYCGYEVHIPWSDL